MKAIVHIGTEKTGTTSIQKFLFQNRKKLRNGGFHFLQSAGSTNNRALPAYFIAEHLYDDFYRDEGILTLEAKTAFRKQFLKNFEHEIGSLPRTVRTVVISSEHFHSRIRTANQMEQVHQFLTTYFDDIRIICYLRDQASTCASYYSTALKSGNRATFMEFYKRCTPENYYYNYNQVLSNWANYFGSEALDVSVFSKKSFLNNSLLDDFTAKLAPKFVGALNREVEIENESITFVGQSLTRGLNLAFPVRTLSPELARLRQKCMASIYQKYRGTGRQPSLAMQQRIYRDFSTSNERVRQKYFPEMAVLFEPPVAEPEPAGGNEEDVIHGLSALFKELKQHGKNIVQPDEFAAIARSFLRGISDWSDTDTTEGQATMQGEKVVRNATAGQGDKAQQSDKAQQGEKGVRSEKAAQGEKVGSVKDTSPAVMPSPVENDTKKHKKGGKNRVVTPEEFLTLKAIADTIENQSLKLARDLATLVRGIEVSAVDLEVRSASRQRRNHLAAKTQFAITYTRVPNALDAEGRREQSRVFAEWLNSFADCIEGSTINVLDDVQSFHRKKNEVVRKTAMSAGFTLIRVDSEEAAHAIAARCPNLDFGGTVFVTRVQQVMP